MNTLVDKLTELRNGTNPNFLLFMETRTSLCAVENKHFIKGKLITIRKNLNSPTFVAGVALLNHFKAAKLSV